ncbi:MAG: tetratricopeptide repeat protein [Phycisphaerales bacterium]|nr:MAG: tetratricopeptide repeat protein [Phycisphaerales bacterium]
MRKVIRSHIRTCVLVFLIVSLYVPPSTFSAVRAQADPEQDSVKTARERLQTRITYACTDEPIDLVLMELADMAQVAVVTGPNVTGNVTARVTDKPLAEALTNILAAHGFTYVATDHMIRVVRVPLATLAKEPLVSRIYRITYADANEVAQTLASFVSTRGKVALDRGTRHIAVTDTPDKIKTVDRLIDELDRETPQVEIEVRIFDITTKEGFELGTEWYAGRNTPRKKTEHTTTKIDSDSPASLTTITTSREYRDEQGGRSEVTSGNYPTSANTQLPGEGKLISSTANSWRDDFSESTTTEELPKTTYIDTETESYKTKRRKPFAAGSFDRLQGGSINFSLLNDAIDLEFALSVLQTQVEAKLLANPRILVMDNETANFEMVRQIPFREERQVGREDPIEYTEFKDVGVTLQVTPHITREGMLRVHIAPEFGVLVSRDDFGVPTVDTRRADTVALVKDGQTVTIGGLRRTRKSKDIARVPVLADVPLFGGLFQSETESEEINEMVVFVTTRIITNTDVLEAGPPKGFAEKIPAPKVEEPREEPAEPVRLPEGALVADANNPQVMLAMALAYINDGSYEQAKEQLASLINIRPDNNTAYQYLGYCHLKLQQPDEALAAYTRAIELNDGDWQAHRGLGVAYMLKSLADKDDSLKQKAVQQWQRSLEVKPDQPTRGELLKLIEIHSK